MKIELEVPSGAEIIERDAYARGVLDGRKVGNGFTFLWFVMGFCAGWIALFVALRVQ